MSHGIKVTTRRANQFAVSAATGEGWQICVDAVRWPFSAAKERSMDYDAIRAMPVSISRELAANSSCLAFHESVLRSYQILEKVKYLLRNETKGNIVIELINMMESTP
jgi:hypothetical protein